MASAPRSRLAASPLSYRVRLDLPERRRPTLTPGQVARTLDELCELGLVEKFIDERRVTRYRPTNGRVA